MSAPSIIHENGVRRVKELFPFLNIPGEARGVKSKRFRTALNKVLEEHDEDVEMADRLIPRLFCNPDLWGFFRRPELEDWRPPSVIFAEVDHTSCMGPVKLRRYADWCGFLDVFGLEAEVWVFEPSGELVEQFFDIDLDFVEFHDPYEKAEVINDYRWRMAQERGLRGPRPGSLREREYEA